MKKPFHGAARLALLSALTAVTPWGCEPDDVPPPRRPAPAVQPAAPSAWREQDGSTFVTLSESDPALQAAIREAQASAETARRRWTALDADGRATWAIKWAAPTIDGGVEYVWVEPIAWSPFRIEGRLASPPQRELQCGRGLEDIVGFPREQLADWLDRNSPAGGFTTRVLEQHFGSPAD